MSNRWRSVILVAAACGHSSSKPAPVIDAAAKPVPDADTTLIADLEPASVVGLQSTEPVARWERDEPDDDGNYHKAGSDDSLDQMSMARVPFTRDGASYVFVIWLFAFEEELNGALLQAVGDKWRPLWVRRRFVSNESDIEFGGHNLPPPLLAIGDQRFVLTTGSTFECEGCTDEEAIESELVTSRVIELTPDGPVEALTITRAPSCDLVEHGDYVDCFVAVDGEELVVSTRLDKKKQTTRYHLDGGKFVPNKK